MRSLGPEGGQITAVNTHDELNCFYELLPTLVRESDASVEMHLLFLVHRFKCTLLFFCRFFICCFFAGASVEMHFAFL